MPTVAMPPGIVTLDAVVDTFRARASSENPRLLVSSTAAYGVVTLLEMPAWSPFSLGLSLSLVASFDFFLSFVVYS
jgi:hypothetical protein